MCSGNPCLTAAVKDVVKAVKNKDGEDSGRTHSMAMNQATMDKMYRASERTIVANSGNRQVLVEERRFQALSATAFILMLRYAH
jgi:hypothetical protein